MTPRSYRQDRRRDRTDRTHARIARAARDLLLSPRPGAGFSLEAVARRARVTRRTVYLQFGSRRALIEAAFDAMAERGRIAEVSAAFAVPDPMDGVRLAVAAFGRFWTAGRVGIRRVRGHAEFDAELAAAMRERNERRRQLFRVLVQRLSAATGHPAPREIEPTVTVLFALTSFEMFDLLAGPDRAPQEVTGVIQQLVDQALQGR
jgi:AcrR family transcriptional regulator